MKTTRVLAVVSLAVIAAAGCKKKKKDTPPPATVDAAVAAAPAVDAAAEAPANPRRVDGFSTPESVFFDTAADIYYVSNINGGPSEKDDNGFISKLNPDGTVAELKWIDGAKADITLHAPKGMAVSEGSLLVADIDTVRIFDLKTGAPMGGVEIKGASFLNDVVADGKKVYVSDTGVTIGADGIKETGSDAVWVIEGGKPRSVLKDKGLEKPNGLVFEGGRVLVVGFGGKSLHAIGANSGAKDKLGELPAGMLDGVAMMNGAIVVSSWECNCLMMGPLSGPYTKLSPELKSPADFTYDEKRNQLVVPLFQDNVVAIYQIP